MPKKSGERDRETERDRDRERQRDRETERERKQVVSTTILYYNKAKQVVCTTIKPKFECLSVETRVINKINIYIYIHSVHKCDTIF